MTRFVRQCVIPADLERSFDWHAAPSAFQRLRPPWVKMRMKNQSGGIKNGATVEFDLLQGPLSIRWKAEHGAYEPPHLFEDIQKKGPFASWHHRHRFEPLADDHTLLVDDIEYRLPMGFLGTLLGDGKIKRDMSETFIFRHHRVSEDIKRHESVTAEKQTWRVAITGASGTVGTALRDFLLTGGHEVFRVSRGKPKTEHDIKWNPDEGELDASALEGMDVVVHLAGKNIAGARWNTAFKKELIDSREKSTRLISEALASLKQKPGLLISASALGFYGDRGDEWLEDDAPPGGGFLSEICQRWENAADPARQAGIRVVHPRIGVVLDPMSGMLGKVLMPTKLGLNGVIGNGKQYISWLTLDDMIYGLHFLMGDETLSGGVNFVTNHPVTNREFTKTLGRVLKRPTLAWAPSVMMKTIFGEMGEALMLSSTRLKPTKLQAAGFEFAYPELEPALRHLLGRHL